jgi:hypothetical protein
MAPLLGAGAGLRWNREGGMNHDEPSISITAGDIVDYEIGPEDRRRYKRCRRQWDFASSRRQNLEPVQSDESDWLTAAFRDALAVYYYPGTWDWQHELKQSLVHKALRRSLEDVGRPAELTYAAALVDSYDACAVALDDFAPVKIQHDVTALLRDPVDAEKGLLAPDGAGITYSCRVDLLAVDAADEYWVVRHQIVEDWHPVEALLLDDEAVAACWAWEQDYLGMEIAGTIHNEIRLAEPMDPRVDEPSPVNKGRPVAQHEPSGGGRSIPQHVRAAVRDARPTGDRVEQHAKRILRRTRIRRSREEVLSVGGFIAAEALEMAEGPRIYPSTGPHCLACEFRPPCLRLFDGRDPQPVLAQHFRRRAARDERKPRLGQATWGFGRGAAPPER